MRDCSFRSADLRDAALGGVDEGRRNLFRRVEFANANLRKSAHCSADLIDCHFANVQQVDFEGDVFVGCKFDGEMRGVVFEKHAYRYETCPANEMKNADFSEARLRFVEFRKLDMLAVKWPTSPEHILLEDYPAALDRVLAGIRGRSDELARRLGMLVAHKRKWVGANQRQGVVNRDDLIEVGGQELLEEFLRLARPN